MYYKFRKNQKTSAQSNKSQARSLYYVVDICKIELQVNKLNSCSCDVAHKILNVILLEYNNNYYLYIFNKLCFILYLSRFFLHYYNFTFLHISAVIEWR